MTQERVPFLALEPIFREETAAGRRLHWKYDGHWNAEGNDLAARLKLAAAQMENPKAKTLLGEKGIFFGKIAADQPQVAFLFPGQGAQHVADRAEKRLGLLEHARVDREVEPAVVVDVAGSARGQHG